MSTVAIPMPGSGIRARIMSHLKDVRDRDLRQLLKGILTHMDSPYDLTWLKDEYRLSQAEYEVLQLLAQGKSPAEISAETGKQVSTVRTQIHKAYTKCRVSNMAELTALLLKRAGNL